MSDVNSPAPVQVHAVVFRPDGFVEITYAEEYELSPAVSVVKTIIIDRSKFKEDTDDLEIAAFELVDEAIIKLRNPAPREPLKP